MPSPLDLALPLEVPVHDDDRFVTASGAARAAAAPDFHLVPPQLLLRTAVRFTQGARQYGTHNFRKGLAEPVYVAQVLPRCSVLPRQAEIAAP